MRVKTYKLHHTSFLHTYDIEYTAIGSYSDPSPTDDIIIINKGIIIVNAIAGTRTSIHSIKVNRGCQITFGA